MKCAAVTGMILVHVLSYFMTWGGALQFEPDSPHLRAVRWGMVIGFLPLILPVTAGCSFFVGIFRALPLGRLSAAQLARPLAIGLGLIGLGYLANVIEIGWRYLWAWQILQFSGLALLALALLAWRLPLVAIPVAGALALFATPWLRTTFGGSHDLNRQALFETREPINSWPFFPWFSLVAFGFALAWLRDIQPSARARGILLSAGGAALIGWALSRGQFMPPFDPASLSGNKMFNPSPDFVLGVMGVAALTLAAAGWLGRRVHLRRAGFVNVFSKGILWIYILHLALLHRGYVWMMKRIDLQHFAAHALEWPRLAMMGGLWLLLLLFSYGVGYAALRLLHDKRIRVRLRRVR